MGREDDDEDVLRDDVDVAVDGSCVRVRLNCWCLETDAGVVGASKVVKLFVEPVTIWPFASLKDQEDHELDH